MIVNYFDCVSRTYIFTQIAGNTVFSNFVSHFLHLDLHDSIEVMALGNELFEILVWDAGILDFIEILQDYQSK